VLVFSGANHSLLYNFFAFDQNFTGGVFVAAGDIFGDGHADIICGADAGGGPNVTVFSGQDGSFLFSFFPYAMAFTGGVRVAGGVTTFGGKALVASASGPGGGPDVRIVDGLSGQQVDEFFAYDQRFTGGLYVAGTAE